MGRTNGSKSYKSMSDKIAKPGQIWQLGDHRLFCGSASEVPQKLFDSKVRMILTDPPYGVAYVENKQHLNMNDKAIIQGDQLQSDEQYAEFTKAYLEAVKPHLDDYNTAYLFNGDLMFCALRDGMKRAGFYYSQMIIWIKNTVVLGRKDYLPQHELIAYGWYGKHKLERSKLSTVIPYPKPSKSKLHPTMKPLGLLRKLISNSTRLGETVYDPFGGSGSTLMACEHLRRKCIMAEIDPAYCSVIIKRWEKSTGKEATVVE